MLGARLLDRRHPVTTLAAEAVSRQVRVLSVLGSHLSFLARLVRWEFLLRVREPEHVDVWAELGLAGDERQAHRGRAPGGRGPAVNDVVTVTGPDELNPDLPDGVVCSRSRSPATVRSRWTCSFIGLPGGRGRWSTAPQRRPVRSAFVRARRVAQLKPLRKACAAVQPAHGPTMSVEVSVQGSIVDCVGTGSRGCANRTALYLCGNTFFASFVRTVSLKVISRRCHGLYSLVRLVLPSADGVHSLSCIAGSLTFRGQWLFLFDGWTAGPRK